LPFSLPQSRIFRAYGLTPDLKMRYGSDIHIIPEILPIFGYSQNLQLADIWFSDIPAFNQPNNLGGYYAIILGTRI
jgi:hypothetical protein